MSALGRHEPAEDAVWLARLEASYKAQKTEKQTADTSATCGVSVSGKPRSAIQTEVCGFFGGRFFSVRNKEPAEHKGSAKVSEPMEAVEKPRASDSDEREKAVEKPPEPMMSREESRALAGRISRLSCAVMRGEAQLPPPPEKKKK